MQNMFLNFGVCVLVCVFVAFYLFGFLLILIQFDIRLDLDKIGAV